MTTFRRLFVALFTVATLLVACNKENAPEVYEGTNTIYLETEKDPVLTLGDGGEITVLLKATYKALRDTRFEVSVKPIYGASSANGVKIVVFPSRSSKASFSPSSANWVKIVEPELVLKKGERELTFHLRALASAKPKEEISQYEISIRQMPDKQMELKAPLRFRLLNIAVPPLSEAQRKLVEGYQAKGLDITPFLGKVNVKTTVDVPAGGAIKDLENPWKKTYEGFSILTLSEYATADKPVLKMVYNAMGMNEFFYFALRKETVENYEYWYNEDASPLLKEVRELIQWTDKSVERFNAVLDSIRPDVTKGDSRKIAIVGNNLDMYGSPNVNVPFQFQYTAWDRLKKLIDAGNLKAAECHASSASSFPGHYINVSGIVTDEYNEGPLKPESEGTWLVNDKKMNFTFYTSVNDAGWYIAVTAEYTGK